MNKRPLKRNLGKQCYMENKDAREYLKTKMLRYLKHLQQISKTKTLPM